MTSITRSSINVFVTFKTYLQYRLNLDEESFQRFQIGTLYRATNIWFSDCVVVCTGMQ